MRIIYYKSPTGNFGDDRNEILWRQLLPSSAFENDDIILLGIGSILREEFLSEQITQGKRVFIFGSGAGTGPLPKQWPNPDWTVLAVRGPLTARLIGKPGSDITDSAALLALTPDLIPNREERRDIIFMPHYNSVEFSCWPQACRLAGITFLDTHRPPHEILDALSRARLVVTEAMHGAIVSDTLRIPWIPVSCSPSIVPFKWVDWTRSMEMDYRPIMLPPSSGWEAIKHFKIRILEQRETHRGLNDATDDELIEDFHLRHGLDVIKTESNIRRMPSRLRSIIRQSVMPLDKIATIRSAEALARAVASPAHLSNDSVFANRVSHLQERLEVLRNALSR